MTAVIQILAYGYSADNCDEYINIGESIAIESLRHFCRVVIAIYETGYMCRPNQMDGLEGEGMGFLGMLELLDYMNCPTAWHDSYRGHHHKPTRILEAVASRDLWIWHSFFGMVGSNNDRTVLNHIPLFDGFINNEMPNVNYVVNGHLQKMPHYLTDGIYPQYATLMQTIPHLTTAKERLFAQRQEAVRMDVERAFGVLQIKCVITQGPIHYWDKDDLSKIMKTCIILHIMIIEDESGTGLEQWMPPSNETMSYPEFSRDPIVLVAHIFASVP